MKRRKFITLLGGAAVTWPLAGRAQQRPLPVIGYLSSGSAKGFATRLAAFRQGLLETGYREGQSVAIEYRWAEEQNDRLPELATELVRAGVTVIAAFGPNAALAAKKTTATIPIVFEMGVDPVASGLVASLSRPDGNITGATSLNVELGPKRLEVLRELAPTATIFALLVNPTNPSAETVTKDLQATAGTLGLELHVLHASSEREFDVAFARLVELRASGLVVSADPFFVSRSERIIDLTLRHAACGDLSVSRLRRRRRADELWGQRCGVAPPSRHLRRPDSQGREAGRSAGPASHQDFLWACSTCSRFRSCFSSFLSSVTSSTSLATPSPNASAITDRGTS
jgi:putative tryptophan/tyrosine transport system substrate-binding protein